MHGGPGSATDLSANRTTLELSGPSARAVLENDRLLFTPGVMVTSVPYLLASSGAAKRRIERETENETARRSYLS